jgi:hypothetical protein
MAFFAVAEELADEVTAGTYAPTSLNACERTLHTDRYPQLLRFLEFTLFADGAAGHLAALRLLVLQPQRALGPRQAKQREADYRRYVVEPFVKDWKAVRRHPLIDHGTGLVEQGS